MIGARRGLVLCSAMCAASFGWGAESAPSDGWLVVAQDGRRREAVPPLVLHVTAADREGALAASGDPATPVAVPAAVIRAAADWLAAQVPADASGAPPPTAGFAAKLGAGKRLRATAGLSAEQARGLLEALAKQPNLPASARPAIEAFVKACGLHGAGGKGG